MSKHTIGKLERVALREVWRHEAHDFTQWRENISVLNEALLWMDTFAMLRELKAKFVMATGKEDWI